MIVYVLLTYFVSFNFVNADYYDCNEPLFDKAVLKATSSSPDRYPSNAKLYGDLAWSPVDNTFDHSLFLNFDQRVEIRSIATQGRTSTEEYVSEYFIQYSDDGESWTSVTDSSGATEMFKGNVDGLNIRRNTFDVPIVAQWIRINPTRWRDRISMRVELYGCPYVADDLYFNGAALVQWHLKDTPINSQRDSIRFRMKTNVANGIILYSRGTQGDYFSLQLRDNRMMLNINLGSGIMTSLSVGSLLDDNIWHDVVISRNMKEILFSVDRVIIHGRVKGDFTHLNLDNMLYIGGVPNIQEGIIVAQNFTGCIENLYLNETNFIKTLKEAYESDSWWAQQYNKFNTLYSCPEQSVVPITFLTEGSYAKLRGYEGVKFLNSSFAFRTYESSGLLMHHKFISNGFVKLYLEDGKIKVEITTENNPTAILDNYAQTFNDGQWHTVVLTINTNTLILNVDQRPMITNRILSITTGSTYYIGGGIHGTLGFVGCMRRISIDGNYKVPTDWKDDEYCCKNEVVFDACQMIDRCNPNPCEHSGVCKQSSREFFCDCSGTGYGGAVCHTPLHPLSCEAYKHVNSVGQRADIKIDIDGSGPLDPFPVTCQFHSDNRVVTEVHHKSEETTTVNGFQEPGSFKQDIIYEANMEQIETLINRSSNCWQHIRYSCRMSRLFNSPSQELDFKPFAWWVSRNNQKMDFWGGSVAGSRKCECGILGQCIDRTKWCNCDSGYDKWLEDNGDIVGKQYLPVKQVRFGDTGTPVDEKEGMYTLGPLMCEGDDLFHNVVTFRITDATINLPTFDFGHSGDVYFEFKTTVENGVLVHSKGPDDDVLIELSGGDTIRFTYHSGNRPTYVIGQTTSRLSDNSWHSVSLERNRKGARVVIDGSAKNEVKEVLGPVRALYLTSDLVVGATVDYRNGFTGCMRAFMLNGQLVDLASRVRNGLYGVSIGCHGKCDSNPCLNNGTCIDRYGGYQCDCRWTSFKGPICADEIGVTLRDSSIIKYDFMGSWRSTIAENIRVGFTTTHPQGFLLGLFSNITGEYMTVTVSNSGHLRIIFDFGFERQEIIFPHKHFGLGQYHDVRIKRKDSGSTLVLLVDDYEAVEYHFNIKDSADAQFNNIQYMYIGRNESMNEGFVGCVSRVEFDDIYPLKMLFQQNGPPNVRSLGPPLMEDFCGVEPITHPPDLLETRPPLHLDDQKVLNAYHETDSALVGGLLFILFLLSIVVALLIGRYVARHKGDYITQEDRGADVALDPDTAVIHSTTGHQVQKKREWFI